MKIKLLAIITAVFSLLILSCEKDAGEGGTSIIKGKIKVEEYNYKFSVLKNTYYAQGEDVYIVYGDETTVGDNIETYHDGSYQFEYLRKGKYTIYVYSEDSTGTYNSGMFPIEKEVEITKNGETLELEDITILTTSKDNSGTSSISGKIFVENYSTSGAPIGPNYYGADEDVYLSYGDDNYYIDDVSTDHDGTYRFDELPIGTYKVYAHSKTYAGGVQTGFEPIIKEVTITENFQDIVLDDIVIKK